MRFSELTKSISIVTLTETVESGDVTQLNESTQVVRAKVTQINGTRYLTAEELVDRALYEIKLWDNNYSNNIKILYGDLTLYPVQPVLRNLGRGSRLNEVRILAATKVGEAVNVITPYLTYYEWDDGITYIRKGIRDSYFAVDKIININPGWDGVEDNDWKNIGGTYYFWAQCLALLTSVTVEDAAPTHVVMTFSSVIGLVYSDFTIVGGGVEGFPITSGSWHGPVFTLVLSNAVVYGDTLSVRFIKTGGTVAITNNVAATVDTPENLAVAEDSRVLTWDDTSLAEEGTQIWVSEDGGDYYLLDTVGEGVETYEDETTTGEVMTYKVRAYVGTTYSDFSDTATFSWVTYWAARYPSDLVATIISDTQINLAWANNGTEDYDGGSIERTDDGGDSWAEIDTFTTGDTSYSDTDITVDTEYSYRIRYYIL